MGNQQSINNSTATSYLQDLSKSIPTASRSTGHTPTAINNKPHTICKDSAAGASNPASSVTLPTMRPSFAPGELPAKLDVSNQRVLAGVEKRNKVTEDVLRQVKEKEAAARDAGLDPHDAKSPIVRAAAGLYESVVGSDRSTNLNQKK